MFRAVILALIVAHSTSAAAQAPEAGAEVSDSAEERVLDVERDPLDAEAQIRFEAGEFAYASGRFEAALDDFRQAHELSGRDELLYNIGLAAERLRRDQEAIDAFEGFLEVFPNHARAEVLRQRITLLEQQPVGPAQSVAESSNDEAAENRPIRETRVGRPSRAGPITLLIGGAALGAGGGVLLALGLSDRNEVEGLEEVRAWNEVSGIVDSAERRSAAGIAMLAVGGAAMLASLIWRLATPATESSSVVVRPDGVHFTF